MAASSSSSDTKSNPNIPDYEIDGVNTTIFHIGTFKRLWKERLKPSLYSYRVEDEDTFDAAFATEMGICPETMTELKSTCSIDSLRCHPLDEPPDTDFVPEDPTLQTLIQRKKKQDYKNTLKINKICRHDLYADEMERLTVGRSSENVENMIPEGELILTLNIYYPAIFDRFRQMRPHMTVLMPGSHFLTELRDGICCVSDLQVCGEFSFAPDMAPDFISKDHHKSAFFFFEGVFYNDMRFPECQDISATSIEWAKTHDFPSYTTAKMEGTRFEDLKIKVGFPYLYCHQGDCEHLVIITDIRLAHKDDCLDRNLYPMLTHKHRVMTRKCSVCHTFIGRWLTTNDRFSPSEPCLFCDKCFRMLHYDTEGNKLGDFLAYPYVDAGAFN